MGICNWLWGVAWAFLIVAPPTAAATVDPDARLIEALRAIQAAGEANDCAKVMKLGDALLAERQGKLPTNLEVGLQTAVAECAYAKGAKEVAYRHAVDGTRLDTSPDELWRLRLFLEMDAKRYPAAVVTAEAMSQGRGAALNSVPMSWFYRLNKEMKAAGLKGERKRLLTVLAADSYVPIESTGDAQGLHFTYAELLADEGETEPARAILATITDPRLLTDALFQPRLAALLPRDLNIRVAAESALVRDRAVADRHPERLDPLIQVSQDLRRLGRPQEALALLQPALARAGEKDAFADASGKLPWLWDEIGRANESLGRYDEAVKAYSTGASVDEQGEPNVSQVINLAQLQVRFGHPQDALKTLAVFEDPKRKASPYGLLEMRLARGCANAAIGRNDAAAADLVYAEAHKADHPDALGYLYLCLGKMDQAAAFFIGGLEDPDKRSRMLRLLSDYDPPPVPIPPAFGGKIETLKARSDVKAAIAKAGGARRIPLQEDDL